MTNVAYDLLIKGGKLVYGAGTIKGDIYIQGEKIAAIVMEGDPSAAKQAIDATRKYVLPGAVDVHTHCDMIVYSDQLEDVTRAAACGGVTTTISVVRPRKDLEMGLLDSIKLYIENGQKTSFIDFSIHAGLMQGDDPFKLVSEIVKMGITSFKMAMAYSKRGQQVTDDFLVKTMHAIAQVRGLVMLHAENGSLIDFLEESARAKGKISAEDYGPTRPGLAESEAVYRSFVFARTVNCPVYYVHISARESIDILLRAKMYGHEVWGETCPQYLLLTDREMTRWGNLAKIAPPLRYEEDLEAMWHGCEHGIVDVIGSDHASYSRKAKEQKKPNIFDAIFGIPGVENTLSLIYQEGVNKGRITLNRMVELLSENPARIFGIWPKKGILQVGSDADILIFDPDYQHTITASTHHSNADYTVYEGWECKGGAILTMLRGKIISEKGELKGKPGYGHFLPRKPKTHTSSSLLRI